MKNLILILPLIIGIAYINAQDLSTTPYTRSNEIVIRKNQRLTTLNVFGKEYSISFEVKLNGFVGAIWASILHFTYNMNRIPGLTPGGNGEDKIPGVWILSAERRFSICNGGVCWFANYVTTGRWIPVRIVQFKSNSVYRAQIFIDNKLIYDRINTNPRVFYNVGVYAGDPWYAAQPGVIRNLGVRDPCKPTNGGCSQTCTNTNGKVVCSCKDGYDLAGDGKTCNKDPCKPTNGGCSETCTNTNGKAVCSCKDGYDLAGDGKTCNKDPCKTANGGCEQTCTNNNGKAVCSCEDGSDLAGDGKTCIKDPCKTANGGCDQTCTNNNGKAVCSCEDGSDLAGDGKTCIKDPCKRANGGCNQTCTNNNGKAICSCEDGYALAGDGKTCNKVPPKCKMQTCKDKLNFAAVGCFNQYVAPMESMKLLFNARSTAKWDAEGFKEYACGGICRCGQAAKDQGYKFFSIRFYGECVVGNDQVGVTEAMGNESKKSKACIRADGTYRPCDGGDCIGEQNADYMYRL